MLGLGELKSISIQGLGHEANNMTIGIHGQEWLSKPDVNGIVYTINELYIGFFFFRLLFEFVEK